MTAGLANIAVLYLLAFAIIAPFTLLRLLWRRCRGTDGYIGRAAIITAGLGLLSLPLVIHAVMNRRYDEGVFPEDMRPMKIVYSRHGPYAFIVAEPSPGFTPSGLGWMPTPFDDRNPKDVLTSRLSSFHPWHE